MAGQRRYTQEFKSEAVRLARTSGQSIRQVALDLGVSNEALGVWLREARAAEDPLTADERQELVELRRRVRTLETEREILKKPRPSSPRRPTGPADGVPVRGAREGPLPGDDDVPASSASPPAASGPGIAVVHRPGREPTSSSPIGSVRSTSAAGAPTARPASMPSSGRPGSRAAASGSPG